MQRYDVIIVGAGPAGLSCAIEVRKADMSVLVLDKGSIVDSIRRFPTSLVWFSTPDLLEIGDIPFVVPTVRPTRIDALNYYQKVAQHYGLNVHTHEAVRAIAVSPDGFRVSTDRQTYGAESVVLATGYFDHPNRLRVPGEDLPHVFHYYTEPYQHHGCDVVVVGGRNSAVEAALDLYRHGARVTIVHRGQRLSDGVKYWILPDIENRIKAGEISTLFESAVKEMHPDHVAVLTPNGTVGVPARFVFVLIGFHPDTDTLSRWGIAIDPDTLAPSHNPATLETNVRGLYVAGSVVAGKNNNKVFVENGRLHGAIIVAAIRARRGQRG